MKLAQLLSMAFALFLVAVAAQGADVTSSLTGTLPVVADPGQLTSPAFGVRLDVSGKPGGGSTPNPSVIVVCTLNTLHADGSLSCDATQTISLVQGHNYTQEKNDGTNSFPLTINTSLKINSDVPCGVTYNVSEHLSGNTGSGVDFGSGATFIDLPFAIQVTCPAVSGCTLSQGFWKQHANAWPLSSLSLGTTNYSKPQLLSILEQSVTGNGLISLAHQLIAAKLNIANGAAGSPISATISSADAMIGSLVVPPVGSATLDPDSTTALTTQLDVYNNGNTPGGPPHCQ